MTPKTKTITKVPRRPRNVSYEPFSINLPAAVAYALRQENSKRTIPNLSQVVTEALIAYLHLAEPKPQ